MVGGRRILPGCRDPRKPGATAPSCVYLQFLVADNLSLRAALRHISNSDPIMKITPSLLLTCALVAACGGPSQDDGSNGASAATAQPTVTIVSPADGSFQEEKDVEVVLRTTVPIAKAGDMTPDTGHHHLYLDADLGDMTQPIPSVPGSIVHMGDGSQSYTFENVGSGTHRIIAVVADGAHVPLQPPVVDTVEFVVE